jgi:hypothetical protein
MSTIYAKLCDASLGPNSRSQGGPTNLILGAGEATSTPIRFRSTVCIERTSETLNPTTNAPSLALVMVVMPSAVARHGRTASVTDVTPFPAEAFLDTILVRDGLSA